MRRIRALSQRCTSPGLATFAGLRQDGAVVHIALTLPWSSGQAEGQINPLKMLEHQTSCW